MKLDLDIAVYILFYNKVDQTIECVESFRHAGVPIYILNNGSSESGLQRLQLHCAQYNMVHIFNSPKNLGVSGGRNFLIRNTTHQWMFFVDNDIVVDHPDKWIGYFHLAVKDSELLGIPVDVFIPKLFNKHDNAYINTKRNIAIGDNYTEILHNSIFAGNLFPGGASILKRKYFDRVGLYEEEMFVGFEDFEIAIRSIKKGCPARCLYIDEITLIHDHRFTRSKDDRESIEVRYSLEKIAASEEFVLKKYGVKFHGDWRGWVKKQVEDLTILDQKVKHKKISRKTLEKQLKFLKAAIIQRKKKVFPKKWL